MKKIIKLFVLGIILFSFVGCSSDKEVTDAIRFKEEYEALNNEEGYNGKSTRVLEISEDNPFVYKSADDILEMMDSDETFVVYFGFASCPWCRSIIKPLMEVADDLGINKIYYVDVKEIRDIKSLDDEGNIITEKEGADDYYELLEKMDSVLEDYTLIDEDGNEIMTGEKRIYAPNIVSVVAGEVVKMTDGISDSQEDAYMELTEEMVENSYDKIKCSVECVIDKEEICSVKTKC